MEATMRVAANEDDVIVHSIKYMGPVLQHAGLGCVCVHRGRAIATAYRSGLVFHAHIGASGSHAQTAPRQIWMSAVATLKPVAAVNGIVKLHATFPGYLNPNKHRSSGPATGGGSECNCKATYYASRIL